jgi:hypothetical protein
VEAEESVRIVPHFGAYDSPRGGRRVMTVEVIGIDHVYVSVRDLGRSE